MSGSSWTPRSHHNLATGERCPERIIEKRDLIHHRSPRRPRFCTATCDARRSVDSHPRRRLIGARSRRT
jgi:hypothetical protein